ncbi:hypothetical protein HYPSUDRAFT_564161 [Hypholoma sublateritium FD-334 SS-4]|uniref:Uncharacterized protein n=1 Tax=Hypholoma sublateritium (strain FD-334 SS-4) TaxID=945553 RepID=A0A0D2PWR9_HYPSF|nr:hypothetical protein HYPSUDRAFT_564161 [Hypholoma sublateritium FD-334 SS-4]
MGPPNVSDQTDATTLSSKFLRKTIFRRSSSFNSPPILTGSSAGDTNLPLENPATHAVEGKSSAHPTTSSEQNESLVASDKPYVAQHIDASPAVVEPCAVLEPLRLSLANSLNPQNDIINSAIVNSASISPSAESDIASSSASSPLSLSPKILPETIVPLPNSSASSSELLLTPEELHLAKILVLDLLGWGVAPEYLVESGISAQAIFRIFTDLNLRLPTNLVVSDNTKAMAYSWGPGPTELTSIE